MYKVSLDRFLGYTYENMQNDLGIFARIFPETIQIDSMGRTEDNRELYHFRIGSANAPKKVLIFGGIHGREYMTSQLLMEQTTEFLMKLCRTRCKNMKKSWREKQFISFLWQIRMELPLAKWEQWE